MYQQDAMDLYRRVPLGTRVLVLGPDESGYGTLPAAVAWSS
jgi:hypothetical protein